MYYQDIGFMIRAKVSCEELTKQGRYVDKQAYAYTSFNSGKVYAYYADAVIDHHKIVEEIVVVGKTIAGKWRIMQKGIGG